MRRRLSRPPHRPRLVPALARLLALLCLIAACPGLARAAAPDSAALLEMRVKGAYLYRFASYVDWPDTAFAQRDSPLRIVIVGADALAGELAAALKAASFNGRPISVQAFVQPSDLNGAHIVFISRSESSRLGALRQSAPGPSLIVTEWDGALRQGSVINFLLVDGQVRFEISLESAKQRNLRLSSRLLTVAHRVDTSEREGSLFATGERKASRPLSGARWERGGRGFVAPQAQPARMPVDAGIQRS